MTLATAHTQALDHRIASRSRRLTVSIALRDAALALLILVLAEVSLQILVPEFSEQIYDHDFTRGQPIALNPDGYRGSLVPFAKEPTELRVLALGDSTTFGTAVRAEETWPAQLEQMLDQRAVGPVSVINGAMPAASLGELAYDYRERWRPYDPDVVIAAVSGNMVSNAWIRRADPPKPSRNGYAERPSFSRLKRARIELHRQAHRLCLPSCLSLNWQYLMYHLGLLNHDLNPDCPVGPLLAYGPRQPKLGVDVVERAWRALDDEIQELADAVKQDRKQLIVTFTPCRFVLSAAWIDNQKAVPVSTLTIDPNTRLADLCAMQGILYADSLARLRTLRREFGQRDPLYVLGDFNHLNRTGHWAVANVLGHTICEVGRSEPDNGPP